MSSPAQIPIPYHDNLIIIEKPQEDVSHGGVLLPQGHFEGHRNLRQGTVVASGPGLLYPDGSHSPMDVQAGDEVLFSMLSGVEIKYDQGSFLVMPQTHVVAIVED